MQKEEESGGEERLAFKQGIPLLDAAEDDDDDEPSYYVPPKKKFSFKPLCQKKFLVIAGITTIVSVILLVCFVVIPVAVVHLPKPPDFEPLGHVVKSELDTREYSVIMLRNGLRVLLVSDKDTEKSAAAMDVAVGSFSNPVDYQGLAHFCEHMLFYSNEKYPEEGAYADFLSSHGGYDNAYTSTQNTNYHFQINSDYLQEALDRFAQFFISPIFSSDAVSREVNAVDAEHRKNLQSDGWRQWQLIKHVSNPSHPFHMFSTGDLETLDKPGVLNALETFYSSHYSSDQMQLVIYGKEDLDTLEDYADSMFSSVEDRHVTRPAFAPKTSFPRDYNGKIVYFVPVADEDSLTVLWQVPPLINQYRQQVTQFLSYMLGDEGHGSVINSLRRLNLAFTISAGALVDTDSYSTLEVDIALTRQGLRRVSEVVATVMQYISVISTTEDFQEKWNDFVSIYGINFKFAPKADPDSFVSSLASTMRNVEKPADFLSAPERFVLNATLVKDTVSYLDPSDAVILLGSREFANMSLNQESAVPLPQPSSLSSVEPIYGTQYEVVEIDDSLVAFWSAYQVKLRLPSTPTAFIPQNFSILTPPTTPLEVPVNLNEGDETGLSVWWLQDTQYQQPKMNMYCDINSAQTTYSLYDPQWTALTTLYTSLITTALISDTYAASLVGFSVDLRPTAHGIRLYFQGYSDTVVLKRYVKTVVNALHNETLVGDQNLFDLTRESLVNDLANYNYTALPYRYIYQYMQSVIMDRPKWKNWQLIEELHNTSVTPALLVSQMQSLLFEGSSLLCFTHGNIGKSEAIALSSMIHSVLTDHSLVSPMGQYYSRRLTLSPGNYSVITPTLNPQDTNSLVNVVFQIGSGCDVSGGAQCSALSLRRTALLGLLTLQMKQSCFDVLRSQLQLGYVAYCTNRHNSDMYSFQVLVQSGTRNASDILQNIDTFLLAYKDTLSEYLSSPTNFDKLKSVFNNVIAIKPLTLSDATDIYWAQVQSGLLQFDFVQQVVDSTDSLTADNLMNFYNDNILNFSSAKKLVIAVHGKDTGSLLDTTFQHDIDYVNLDPRAMTYP